MCVFYGRAIRPICVPSFTLPTFFPPMVLKTYSVTGIPNSIHVHNLVPPITLSVTAFYVRFCSFSRRGIETVALTVPVRRKEAAPDASVP